MQVLFGSLSAAVEVQVQIPATREGRCVRFRTEKPEAFENSAAAAVWGDGG